MEEQNNNQQPDTLGQGQEYKGFAAKRIAGGVLVAFAVLWIAGSLVGYLGKSAPKAPAPSVTGSGETHALAPETAKTPEPAAGATDSHAAAKAAPPVAAPAWPKTPVETLAPAAAKIDAHAKVDTHASPKVPAADHGSAADSAREKPRGVAFVAAAIEPLHYELSERFWGWRPNDILNFTDNVNNLQLGVLEVSRRTAVILAERLSRTGSTAAFDRHLESAMNWLMIKPEDYWFPSPESKYKAALKEWGAYLQKLEKGEATFFTRPDNLIPLLAAYEDLLGSCDENLVKAKEADGSAVGFFSADDYFFYGKGVAMAMHTILEAVAEDFKTTLDSRKGSAEVIHHAVESLKRAIEIDPLIITNSDLSGILANHRANMAAPISHARFYIEVLIKTLST